MLYNFLFAKMITFSRTTGNKNNFFLIGLSQFVQSFALAVVTFRSLSPRMRQKKFAAKYLAKSSSEAALSPRMDQRLPMVWRPTYR